MRISLFGIAEGYTVKPQFAQRKTLFSINSDGVIDLGRNGGFRFEAMKRYGIDGFGASDGQNATKR